MFSHPSEIDLVTQAKTLGYEIVLIFIHLDLISLNQARVAQRAAEGGHNAPAEKVTSRIPRLLNHIKQTLPLCDFVSILDNSRADNPFQQVAILRNAQRCRRHSVRNGSKENAFASIDRRPNAERYLPVAG